jgi:hypothetical protein
MLPLPRQALHASEWSYHAALHVTGCHRSVRSLELPLPPEAAKAAGAADLSLVFQSPLPGDWQALLGNMTTRVAEAAASSGSGNRSA